MSHERHIVDLKNERTVQHINSRARNEVSISLKRFKKRVRENVSREYEWRAY